MFAAEAPVETAEMDAEPQMFAVADHETADATDYQAGAEPVVEEPSMFFASRR